MNWTIRGADRADWPEISRISQVISLEDSVGDHINEIGERYMDLGKFYVAESDRILGYQHVLDVPDGSIYLSGLRVIKEGRRIGIARGLIDNITEEWALKGKKSARSHVGVDNKPSLGLLSNLGFMRVAELYLYRGSIDVSEFTEVDQWPDAYIDISHVPAKPFPGITEAMLYQNGNCLISVSSPSKWDENPTFTILKHEGCKFSSGHSFMASEVPIPVGGSHRIEPLVGFDHVYVMEKTLC